MDHEALIQGLIRDDEAAFERFIREYTPSAYRLAAGMLKDTEEAEDAVQEAFVKAWKHRKRIDPEKPLKPWILKIVRNAVLDLMRKKKNPVFSQFDTEDDGNAITDSLTDEEPLAHELFETKERETGVRKALETLSAYERHIITLRYEEGLTFEEIATVLDKPMNTVKSSHRRALLSLKKILPN